MKKIVSVVTFVCVVLLSCFSLTSCGESEIITDLSYYGTYQSCMPDDLADFFPELDESIMSDIFYIYTDGCFIDCANEVYVEFTIKDEKAFHNFVEENIKRLNHTWPGVVERRFEFDNAWNEVVITDTIRSDISSDGETIGFDNTCVQKMMYNDIDNTVVFVYLYVMDWWEYDVPYYPKRFDLAPELFGIM